LIPFPLGWCRLALSLFSVAVWPLLFATSRESSRRLPCVVEATDSATSSPSVFVNDSSLQLTIGSWRVQNVVRAVWNVSHMPVFLVTDDKIWIRCRRAVIVIEYF